MRPVVSAQHLKATGLTESQPVGGKRYDSDNREAVHVIRTCVRAQKNLQRLDVFMCGERFTLDTHKSVAPICSLRRPLKS